MDRKANKNKFSDGREFGLFHSLKKKIYIYIYSTPRKVLGMLKVFKEYILNDQI